MVFHQPLPALVLLLKGKWLKVYPEKSAKTEFFEKAKFV